MKTFLASLSVLFVTALCALGAGAVSPLTYTFSGDPTGVSTNSINPPPGSVIVDGSSGHRAIKVSPRSDNSVFAVQEVVLSSGTAPVTLSGTVTATSTIVTLPSISGTFAFVSADVLITGTTAVTAAPTFVIQSGTGTLLTGTITLGTTLNQSTRASSVTNVPMLSGTAIELRTITTGTATSITGKLFVRGYFLP